MIHENIVLFFFDKNVGYFVCKSNLTYNVLF
jgi:hypothetical protein